LDAFTTAEGLAAKQTGKGEFAAPDKAIQLIKAKDYGRYASPELGTLPVDFLSTVDITNGNSGSSTLNARGEFVGLAFDGTLEGVVSDWLYDPSINRTIHVDSRFMLWTMDKVDGAQRLLGEMGVTRRRRGSPTPFVIASEAKQSSAAGEARWIASSFRSSQ
jgi:hypothetical protein